MAEVDQIEDPGYPDDAAGRLEMIRGEGFLSPGGLGDVSRILGGRDIEGCQDTRADELHRRGRLRPATADGATSLRALVAARD